MAKENAKKAAAGAIPLCFTSLLEMDTTEDQSKYLQTWAANMKYWVDMKLLAFLRDKPHKAPFTVPGDVMLIPPLAITASSGSSELAGFREVLHFKNMMLSFAKTGQYLSLIHI